MEFLEALKINSCVSHGSILGLTHYIFHINDLPKNIPRSLVNIYAGDSTVYRCTNKIWMSRTSQLISRLMAQWWKDWLVKSNRSQAKLVTFYHHREYNERSPITVLNVYWDSRPLGIQIYDLLLKMHDRMVGSLYGSSKYLIPPAMLYLYKRIFCYKYAAVVQSTLQKFIRVYVAL